MTPAHIDVDLSAEEEEVRNLVHRFALEVLRPSGQMLDRLNAEQVIAPGSLLWDVHRRWDALGVRVLTGDIALTPVQVARLNAIVTEELGWGDAGLAISLGAAEFPAMLAAISQNPQLMAEFPSSRLGCWAITEPDHGSDALDLGAGGPSPGLRRPNCVARREGDQYVIDGQKAAWVSNGPVATAAALYTCIDDGDGVGGFGVLLVDLTRGSRAAGRSRRWASARCRRARSSSTACACRPRT
jgi:alkylation response protein AidB-like acyl-CoA dehydrogenase